MSTTRRPLFSVATPACLVHREPDLRLLIQTLADKIGGNGDPYVAAGILRFISTQVDKHAIITSTAVILADSDEGGD